MSDDKIVSLDEDLTAEVRAGEILQVITNVIVNALDALSETGTLRLRVRRDSSAVHIVIADNGHGVLGKHSERIFEPFLRRSRIGERALAFASLKRSSSLTTGPLLFSRDRSS